MQKLKNFTVLFLYAVIFSVMFVSSGFSEETLQYAKGYVKPPIDFSHIGRSTPEKEKFLKDKASSFPVSYDLRKLNRVNKTVGKQSPYGTCGAFSALGAMESNYMTQGLTSLGTAPNLSELHLAWFTYKDPVNGHSFTINKDKGVILDQGEHSLKISALLSRMSGPVKETSMPYSKAGTNKKKSDSVMTKYVADKKTSDYFPLALNLKECLFLGSVSDDNREKQKENIKKMLSVYGAVEVSYYAGEDATSPADSTTAYFDNSHGTETNHAVLIVGWNDNFSKTKFNKTKSKRPKNNGAWIVKNSWGKDWGNNGYFYMSYEQYINMASVYIVEEPKKDEKVYYHDALGFCDNFGYGKNKPAYAANVFKATATEGISSVGVYATGDNTSFEIYICNDLGTKKPSSPASGDVARNRIASGTFTNAGYHKVEFYEHVLVKKNHYFSVIVKMTTPNFDKPIVVERVVKDYSEGAVVKAKESYFSPDMLTWTDGTKIRNDENKISKSNACIKVFTLPAIAINKTNFPDEIFRNYVMNCIDGHVGAFLKDKDGYLTIDEINGTTKIDIPGYTPIANLKGIEYFTALEYLNCSNYPLTNLDVSKLTSLKYLYCRGTQLTKLDVSKCTSLKYLDCVEGYGQNSKLTTLTLGNNTALEYLDCASNQLTKLDVSKCTALQHLYCSSNQLTTLTIGKNTALQTLDCQNNQLTKLDVSKCTALQYLKCYDNKLTTLTLGNNTALIAIDCRDNKLTKLDVSKCTALQCLECSRNQLTTLTLGNNTALESLYCENNQLTKLDVSKCTYLHNLSCQNSQLKTLTLVNNTLLYTLNCAGNQLKKLDVSECTFLRSLNCSNNKLTSLKLGNNMSLREVYCQKNKLKKIDVSGCPNINPYYFHCDSGVEIIRLPLTSNASKSYSTQNETNGHSNVILTPAQLKISSNDILWQGSERDEDLVKVKANSPVTFIIGDWLKPDKTVENISYDNIQIFVDDKFVEGIKISDEKIFILPADFVHDDFKVGVKAKIYGGEFESEELYISAE